MNAIIFSSIVLLVLYWVFKTIKNHKTLIGVSHCIIKENGRGYGEYILTLKYKPFLRDDLILEEYVMELSGWESWYITRTSDGLRYYSSEDFPNGSYDRAAKFLVECLKTSLRKEDANKKVQKYYENLVSEYDEALKKQFEDLEKKQGELNKARVLLEESKEAEVKIRVAAKDKVK